MKKSGEATEAEKTKVNLCSQPWTRRPAGAIRCSSPRKCHIRGFSAWRMQLGGFAVSVSNSFETQSVFEEGTMCP